jgi:protein SCO1/2
MRSLLILASTLILFSACKKSEPKLPVFGERDFNGTDTVYHKIAPFSFVDQDSVVVNNSTFKGKIYVADFFFTTCRTICPVMKTQMKRVYEATAKDPDVLILSHTIDPAYDDVPRLHNYARMLEVSSDRWHFVTGVRDSIYKIAQTSYFATAREDRSEPDGFIHSGAFLLIDKHQRIRGKYDGTREADVDRLLNDIRRLQNEGE